MKWPWERRNRKASKKEPPVVRPPQERPITEFEAKLLEDKGVWLTVRVQVTKGGSWVNWKHDIPEELRVEAKDALVALCLELQDGELTRTLK